VPPVAAAIDYMSEHLVVVVGRAEERVRRATEQVVARAIQQEILPAGDMLREGRVALAGCVRPSTECGADFWGCHAIGDDRILVVVGGVSGHGVNAVLVAAAAKAACDAVRAAQGAELELSALLEAMNGAVFQQARRRMNVTCFASIVDPQRRVVRFANAGHVFPYVLRGGEAGEFSALKSRGNRLGESRESRWEPTEASLDAVDAIVWYTDGVLDSENQNGERYGDKRLRAAVRRSWKLDVGPLRDRVVSDVLEFCGAMPPKDDVTVVVGKIS
jgi:serine phosphatase RsbU (regulator of sigma subunit)